jgi:nicotinamidase-related amidase
MKKANTISRRLLFLVFAMSASVFILSVTNGLAQTPTSSKIQGGDTWSTYSDMKMVLKFDEPKPVTVDPAKTILQIVDMQEYFVGPKQRANMWRGDNNIKNVKSLLELARKLDMNVVYQYSMGVTNPYEKRQKASPFKLYGPIIDELKPLNKGKEYFVPKSTHDIFFHTTMDDLLKTFRKEVDTVILTGTLTHVCVLYAVSGYCVRGYRVIVPMDGVIDDTPENQAMTLHVMSIRSANYPATITLSNMITFEPAPQMGK